MPAIQTQQIPGVGKASLTNSQASQAPSKLASNSSSPTANTEKSGEVKQALYAFLTDTTDKKSIQELDKLSTGANKNVLGQELTALAKTEKGKEAVQTLASAGNAVAADVLQASGSSRAQASGTPTIAVA